MYIKYLVFGLRAVYVLIFRVRGPYLSFGTLYEDKIEYTCSPDTLLYTHCEQG